MKKYQKGDQVVVLSGKDKGRTGIIELIYPKRGSAIIPGINMYKKHVKKSVAQDGKGGIYEIPKPIHLSKLAHIDPKTKKPTRVRFETKKGKKVRLSAKSGKEIGKTTKKSKKKEK